MIIVVVEVKDEEGDEASKQANDGHADVVAKGTLRAAAGHFQNFQREGFLSKQIFILAMP